MTISLAEPTRFQERGLSDRDAWGTPSGTSVGGTTMLTGRPGAIRKLIYPLLEGYLIIEVEDELPPWLEATVSALISFLDLPPDWDSYGAKPVNPDIVPAVLELMDLAMRDETPPPTVIPTNRGGVQLEWHRNGVDLEIEFRSISRVFVSFEDATTGEDWEYNVSANLTPLIDCLKRL